MSIELNFRLDNGLRVFIQETHAAPVVAIQMWINVGSADERPEEAGVAHQLEHMLFKGTARRGVGAIAQEVEGAGGEINAYTSYDQTVYHLTLASRHFDLGLDILSDMIQNPLIDARELEMEKEVVLEEVRRAKDSPTRELSQAVFSRIFAHHPYGRPVIGFEETVRSFDRSVVHEFFSRWYTPDNMVLVVAGDVDARRVKRAITREFRGFQRPRAPARARVNEPGQLEPRLTLLQQNVQEAHLELAFPGLAMSHADTPLLDLLAIILGQGESSRLTEHVRNQKQLVNRAYAYAYTPAEPGAFVVGAAFKPERRDEVLEAVLEEIHQVRSRPVRTSELRKAQSILRSERVYERETVDGRARKFGYFLLLGGLEVERRYFRGIEDATVEGIWRVARSYLQPERLTVGLLLPRDLSAPDTQSVLETCQVRLSEPHARPPALRSGRSEEDVVRIELPNGIRLLVKPNHSVPLVAIKAVFEGGLRFEKASNNGVFQMMGSMLTRGTSRRKSFQIAHEVDSLAGSLNGFGGRNSFGLRAEMLSQHLERGLELFSEVLLEPSFEPHELERLRRMTLEAIRNRKDRPAGYAALRLQEAIFKRHPFRFSSLGTQESVQSLSSAVLRRTWAQYARTQNLVLAVVGDVDPADMEQLVSRQLSGLRAGMPEFPEVPVEAPMRRVRLVHEDCDKQQLHLVFGWRSPALDHPDRFAMQVLSSVLSGQGGRLFLELRDKQGLAYSVHSGLMEAIGEGYFSISMGTEPSKAGRSRNGILEEVRKLLQEGILPGELERAQRTLVGSYEIDLQRAAALCSNLAFNELYGLGYDHYRLYPERILAVAREEVLEVARRYLSTEVYALSIVGPPDQARSEEDPS